VLVTGILVPIGTDLGDVEHISWIVGGWSIASSISFSLAGAISDVFGRRWTVVSGEVISVIGSVSEASLVVHPHLKRVLRLIPRR
jgi:MFS family permease